MTDTNKETFSSFINKVLAGTAIAIVVASFQTLSWQHF